MKPVPCAIIFFLMIGSVLVSSCTAPLLCPFGPIEHAVVRPPNIARSPDLILLTHDLLFETVARNMHPSWSPDSRELVFERAPFHFKGDSGLCVIQADGSHPTMLWPIGGTGTMEPAWSPIGDWIACWVFDKHALMLLNRDGCQSHRVSDQGYNPSWSPNGQRLVYERYLSDSDVDICLINWDGTGFQTLLGGPTDARDPAWSPDGHRIAFASNRDGTYNIYVMNVDGTQITQITHAAGDPKRGMIQPTWSPDGTRIAFVCSSDSIYTRHGVLYAVDVAAGEPILLLDAKRCYDPAWSPDGDWLAFSYGGLDPSGPQGSDIYLLRMKQ